jgi:SAM-dependent methyltransferase
VRRVRSEAYQPGFYAKSSGVRDRDSRLRQAAKISYILTGLAGYPLNSATCLDLGCSSGTITGALAPLFATTIGLDYDTTALRNPEPGHLQTFSLVAGDAMHLPLGDASVDVIICAQVYEHVPDDTVLAAEMFRVLSPGGVVFFSGPNKLFPIELHYHLPFLHWLPDGLADRCLQILRRGDCYYERSRTLWGLRRLFQQFAVRDVTFEVLRRYIHLMRNRYMSALLRVPSRVWAALLPFFPNYNWILWKPEGPSPSSARSRQIPSRCHSGYEQEMISHAVE